MAYTLDDLKKDIEICANGKAVAVHYDVYEELFPPGEPDEGARERAYKFAGEHGCTINNRVTDRIVYFVKPK